MKLLLFLHKQAKTKICLKTIFKIGKPLGKLFQTFDDAGITFSSLKKSFL